MSLGRITSSSARGDEDASDKEKYVDKEIFFIKI